MVCGRWEKRSIDQCSQMVQLYEHLLGLSGFGQSWFPGFTYLYVISEAHRSHEYVVFFACLNCLDVLTNFGLR